MRRGQISIFVIVGIMLVGVVILFFFLINSRQTETSINTESNPESFVDECIRDSIRKNTEIMLPQGGFLNPGDYKIYNDAKIAYICKNINYYESCVMQYPRFLTRISEELEEGMNEDIQDCFISLEEDLSSKRYSVSGGEFDISIVLKPGSVEGVVYRNMRISKEGYENSFESFSASVKSPLYDLSYIANEIARQEAKYCYFEYVGFMLLYNKFDVRKTAMSDSTKIYTIKDKASGEEMNIAIRGCAIPAGF